MRLAGRDRLPAWVVRMRSVLCFMIPGSNVVSRPNGSGAHAFAPAQAGINIYTDRVAALIAWMLVVRVGNLVKDGAKRRRLRRSAILDKIANTNRVPSMRSRPLS